MHECKYMYPYKKLQYHPHYLESILHHSLQKKKSLALSSTLAVKLAELIQHKLWVGEGVSLSPISSNALVDIVCV